MFVEANPQRTLAGALYQIDMRLTKGAQPCQRNDGETSTRASSAP